MNPKQNPAKFEIEQNEGKDYSLDYSLDTVKASILDLD